MIFLVNFIVFKGLRSRVLGRDFVGGVGEGVGVGGYVLRLRVFVGVGGFRF